MTDRQQPYFLVQAADRDVLTTRTLLMEISSMSTGAPDIAMLFRLIRIGFRAARLLGRAWRQERR